MPLTVGTAGHIDHGKTWLVRALTGRDTDRLPEEQARGISIDLGYAPLELPDGRRLSLVDVPGHERFVRTMVAGATGIDVFLLVIDAAEGARPQTLEHLQIVRLLGIRHGVVAVTKADTVDAETLELAVEEARELVPEAEVVPVSAATGQGLDELRAALARAADAVERRASTGGTRLHVDRVFTLARDRHGRHRHALGGLDRRGRRAPGRAPRPAGPRPLGAGARHAGRAGRGRAARRRQPARDRALGARARRRPRRARLLSRHLPARRPPRAARGDPRRRHRPPRHGRDPGPRRPPRLVRPAPARAAAARRPRRPRRPPHRRDRRRRRRARPVAAPRPRPRPRSACSTAATRRRSSARSSTRP